MKSYKSDPVVFTWHIDNKSSSILYKDEFFKNNVIEPLKGIFNIGSEFCTAFKYLGLNISQSDKEIILDQNFYIINGLQVKPNLICHLKYASYVVVLIIAR